MGDTTRSAGPQRKPVRKSVAKKAQPTPPPDGLVKEVAARKRMMKAHRIAVHELEAEDWKAPEDRGSLTYQYENPAPDPEFAVDGLLPANGIAIVAAQWKCGKTTFAAVNLSHDLAAGVPFLDKFGTSLNGRNIGIWNMECSDSQLQSWMFARFGDNPEVTDRIFPQHLRGQHVDIESRAGRDWTVGWLKDNDIGIWIPDPLSKLYHGPENDNSEFNRWWRQLELIKELAGVDLIVLPDHTGHGTGGDDEMARMRGASAKQGAPDVVISYRHGGDLGTMPRGTRRYLSAFGRGIEIWPEVTLEFDPEWQRLYAVRGEGRSADKIMALAEKAAVEVYTSNGKVMNAGELKAAIGGAPRYAVKAIRYAVERGWLSKEDLGTGKPTLYTPGPMDPNEVIRIG
jgi:AAA domain